MEGARTRGLCQWETKLVMHFRPFLVPIPGIDTILTQASIHTSIVKRVSIGNVKDNHITLRACELLTREHIAVHGSVTNVELQCNRGYMSSLMYGKFCILIVPLGSLVSSRLRQHTHTGQ